MTARKKQGPKTKAIMIQGTASHVGKSIITAALCRIFYNKGINAAPFKAQNMALNSYVTKDGGEIGRAQVLQAEAAGLMPCVDMNPILLKPTSDMKAQVIIHGRVYGNMNAWEYHRFKKQAKKYVMESYRRLTEQYDVIVIEGAGSPAEINLRENDIANMGLAEMVDAPVLLIGDIDKGGVFASLVGTMELLKPYERKRIKGFIINKFRGDIKLLKRGIDFLERKTGIPVIGIVPYMKDIILPDEDGVALEKSEVRIKESGLRIKVAIIKLPRISNFTDFDPFKIEPDVDMRYAASPEGLDNADIVIIPGTKNTISDVKWLWDRGIAKRIMEFAEHGGRVIGICGGFQMLGKTIKDPFGMETGLKEGMGLGLLDVETIMERDKKTYQVKSKVKSQKSKVSGYEIHMGKTLGSAEPFSIITNRNGSRVRINDGAAAGNSRVWGTYIHGIFDNDGFRTALLNDMRQGKGLLAQEPASFVHSKMGHIDKLADVVKKSLDMKKIFAVIGVDS